MALVTRWRRGVLLAALAALLSMHGVGAGHDATGAMSISASAAMSMSMSMTMTAHPVDTTDDTEASGSTAVGSLPPSSHLLMITCLALLGFGVTAWRRRGARLPVALRPSSLPNRMRPRSGHWPRGPDPVLDLCTSRT